MDKKKILSLLMIGFSAMSLYTYGTVDPQHSTLGVFETWMKNHNKIYATEEEKMYRFGVWMDNFVYVQEHNTKFSKGHQTYDLEMNAFADLTNEQFGAKYLMLDNQFEQTKQCTGKEPSQTTQKQVDWSKKGAVTAIKNQGQCGSCWAFSTTGSVEGAYYLKNNQLLSFSEQQLVDCSTGYGNHGCGGGLMDNAFWYIIDNKLNLQQDYRYKGVNQKCAKDTQKQREGISNCHDVKKNNENALRNAVAQQPVSVAIQANHISFQLYKSGVYKGNCGTKLDHGVLAVGYGYDDEHKSSYWKVKNSWGNGWGDQGFIRIERKENDTGKGKCGIYEFASFPIM